MIIAHWPCAGGQELSLSFDQTRAVRLLILPALFEEANKLRHFTLAVMGGLDRAGVDSFLPDFPGWNESLAPLADPSIPAWRECAKAAANHFSASHVLTIRASASLAPPNLPGWHYAPHPLPAALKQMLRARVLASRELGSSETGADLLSNGREHGLTLSGYPLSAAMVRDMADATISPNFSQSAISHSEVGGPALWLSAEPQDGLAQADALVRCITERCGL